MRNVVVGTAGHIDHGKSSLVKALTGTDPDRLKEEKDRGITIDLGFAHTVIDGIQFGFVDVPGHERFVKNMLAGVGGMDLVIMVVAADESIMPQTREHFDICRLLGIRAGMVAITKTDLVEPELIELVQEEVKEAVHGSFLENGPVIAVSTRTMEGVDQVRQALRQLAGIAAERPLDRALRLAVDRSFSMKGFGTVVTGTMVAGKLERETEVELLPGGLVARVRGLQVHGKAMEEAAAGQRTAVNLQGVDLAQVRRGMVLTKPGLYRETQLVDVRLTLLPGANPVKNLLKVRFHQGTAEILARVALLDRDRLEPGDSGYAQLRLDAPVFCLHGDAFIVRRFSPTITIGGGRILHPHPSKHRAGDRSVLSRLKGLETEDMSSIVPLLIACHPKPTITVKEISACVDRLPAEVDQVCTGLGAGGELALIPGPSAILLAREIVAGLQKASLLRIERYHREFPLLRGMPREELRMRVFQHYPPEVFRYCLDELAALRRISLLEDAVALYGRGVQLSPEGLKIKERIEQTVLEAGYQPPSLAEIVGALREHPEEIRKIYFWMLKERLLVKISEDLAYHRDTLEEIKTRIRSRYPRGATFGVAAFKELFDLTRKHAIPLLEHLDRERFTRRQGNERVLV